MAGEMDHIGLPNGGEYRGDRPLVVAEAKRRPKVAVTALTSCSAYASDGEATGGGFSTARMLSGEVAAATSFWPLSRARAFGTNVKAISSSELASWVHAACNGKIPKSPLGTRTIWDACGNAAISGPIATSQSQFGLCHPRLRPTSRRHRGSPRARSGSESIALARSSRSGPLGRPSPPAMSFDRQSRQSPAKPDNHVHERPVYRGGPEIGDFGEPERVREAGFPLDLGHHGAEVLANGAHLGEGRA